MQRIRTLTGSSSLIARVFFNGKNTVCKNRCIHTCCTGREHGVTGHVVKVQCIRNTSITKKNQLSKMKAFYHMFPLITALTNVSVSLLVTKQCIMFSINNKTCYLQMLLAHYKMDVIVSGFRKKENFLTCSLYLFVVFKPRFSSECTFQLQKQYLKDG